MFAAVLAIFSFYLLPAPATPAELLAQRGAFHRRTVIVRGALADYRPRTSRAGNQYTTFSLASGGSKVTVFHRGHANPPLRNGDRVIVTGLFEKERKVGNFTVQNQLDATEATGRPFGVRKE
ncbi:MAG: hypothetical protein IT207_00445 [Fimbriimonadaceae bacterium]|nr:hypothetical protein [Fimbriimonadaceae bacterium]